MIEVALETSHRQASVAVRIDGRLEERLLSSESSHASDTLSELDKLLRATGATPGNIDAVFVGTGPGSYTGLRIGIATALGLARGAEAVLRGEPSGETLAWRELNPGEECVYLLDARQGELYFAHYRRLAKEVEVVSSPRVILPTELVELLPADGALFGDQRALELAGLEREIDSRFRWKVIPRAGALLELAGLRCQELGPQSFEDVEPLYLRPFQARIRKR